MRVENRVLRHSHETLAMFIDFHNLQGSLRNEGLQTDLISLRDYLAQGRRLLETFLYIGFNPNNSAADEQFHRMLRLNGFMVKTKKAKVKPDGSLKCDLDTEIVLDTVDYVLQVKPEIVTLVSGDGDFSPLAQWLRHRGIRVEVASTLNSLSQDLQESANGYIDLAEALNEIQAEADGEIHTRKEVNENGRGDHQWPENSGPGHSDG